MMSPSRHTSRPSRFHLSRRALRASAATAVAAVAVTVPLAAAPAQAEVPFVPFTSYLPPAPVPHYPTTSTLCPDGDASCLETTLGDLAAIFNETASSCSHNAIFSHAYLRITQTYEWSRVQPGYYADVPFANHQDAVFAQYYIDAYNNWKAGNRSEVPKAWKIAFDTARDKRVSGLGDLLLGMNAHINRDLPFVVAEVGLTAPDGSTRKVDYDKVEQFLNDASAAMMTEAAARLDPGMDDLEDPTGVTYALVMQVISAARENAWRNAEALASAPTPTARALVAAKIEADAEAIAYAIKAATSYVWPFTTTTSRDQFCADHNGDPAPMAYPFGPAAPWGP